MGMRDEEGVVGCLERGEDWLDQELKRRLAMLSGCHGRVAVEVERRRGAEERRGDVDVDGASQLEARSPAHGMRQATPNALFISCNGGSGNPCRNGR